MQETEIQSLIQEYPTCHRAAEPAHPGAQAPQRERPLQREACAPRLLTATRESPQQRRPRTAKNEYISKKIFLKRQFGIFTESISRWENMKISIRNPQNGDGREISINSGSCRSKSGVVYWIVWNDCASQSKPSYLGESSWFKWQENDRRKASPAFYVQPVIGEACASLLVSRTKSWKCSLRF